MTRKSYQPMQGGLDQLDDYARTGVLNSTDAQALRELVSRIPQSITR